MSYAIRTVTMNRTEVALLPVLPVILAGSLEGRFTPVGATEVILAMHHAGLGATARGAVAGALAPCWPEADAFARIFGLRSIDLQARVDLFQRASRASAPSPAEALGAPSTTRSALLWGIAAALDVPSPETLVDSDSPNGLRRMNRAEIKEELTSLFGTTREPAEEVNLMGRLHLPVDGIDLHAPRSIDAQRFLLLLAGSLSSSLKEKVRIIESVPRLRLTQLEQLIEIWKEEQRKFHKLDRRHALQVRKLVVEYAFDWLDVVDELRARLRVLPEEEIGP